MMDDKENILRLDRVKAHSTETQNNVKKERNRVIQPDAPSTPLLDQLPARPAEEVITSGQLMVQRVSTSSNQVVWQKRNVELTKEVLLISKAEKLVAVISLQQIGAVNHVGPISDNLGKGVMFKVTVKNKVYTLRGRNESEVDTWISHISDAVNAFHPASNDISGVNNGNDISILSDRSTNSVQITPSPSDRGSLHSISPISTPISIESTLLVDPKLADKALSLVQTVSDLVRLSLSLSLSLFLSFSFLPILISIVQ